MNLNPYLSFPGTCAEAFAFYAEVFGGEIPTMSRFGDGPMAEDTPPERLDWVMHGQLRIGGRVIMASDNAPEHYAKPQGFWLQTEPATVEEGRRLFDALAEGGEVVMPYEKTFWAEGFGMVRDRFDIPWMINCFGGDR